MNAATRFILRLALLSLISTGAIAQITQSVSTRWGLHLGGNYNIAGIGFGNWVKDPNRNGPQFSELVYNDGCLLYTSPSPRDRQKSRMPSSA